MSKYTPATFQPTVRPDWAGILSYLSDKEKSEILTALLKYPSVECNSAFWKETIKPDLDLQYQAFTESCKAKSRGVRNRWGKISITDVKDMNKTSIRDGIDTEREREDESKSESKSENKGGVGEKETIDTNARKNATDALLNKMAKSFGMPPDHSTQVGKTPIPPALKEFLLAEFRPAEITRLKHWLAENKSGEVMKNESILKAACTISNKNYADVACRFLRFGLK